MIVAAPLLTTIFPTGMGATVVTTELVLFAKVGSAAPDLTTTREQTAFD